MKKRLFFMLCCMMLATTVTFGQTVAERRNQLKQRLNEADDADAKALEVFIQDYLAKKISAEEYKKRMNDFQERAAKRYEEFRREEAKLTAPLAATFDASRLDNLYERMRQVEVERNEGRLNKEEADRRLKALEEEYNKEMAQVNAAGVEGGEVSKKIREVETQVLKRWPGKVAGWPPLDGDTGTRTLCGLGTLRQSSGTRASHSFTRMGYNGPVNSMTIYQTGGNVAGVFADMKRQIEAAAGKEMSRQENGEYRVWIQGNITGGTGFNLHLSQQENRVTFEIIKQ